MNTTVEKKNFKNKISFKTVLIAIFSAVLLGFFFFYDQNAYKGEINQMLADILSCMTFVGCAAYFYYLYKIRELNTKSIVILTFICGFVFRLAYVLKCGYTVNQHDVESLISPGHLSYMNNIAIGNGLPESNEWQYNHPPLHHLLSAAVIKVSTALGFRRATAFENVQLLTCLWSTLTMFGGYSLLKEFEIKDKTLIFSLVLLAFHPTFYLFAGSINNDILSILLSLYALLYLIRWYKSPSVKNAILCGLAVGLGMMTKFSVAVMAVVAAISVLIKLFTDKSLKFPRFLSHAACFLLSALPLGLWYQIRNMVLFNQPLGYVAPISTTSQLYVGDVSLIKRFILPFPVSPTSVFADPWEEYNVWYYALRSSLFGEYQFKNAVLASVATICALLLTLAAVTAFVFLIVKFKKTENILLPVLLTAVIQLVFFIYFNLKYPFGCTMDFRYIVPIFFCSVVFVAKAEDVLINRNVKYGDIVVSVINRFLIVFFVVTSFLVYFGI